jgi:hypothetical protein
MVETQVESALKSRWKPGGNPVESAVSRVEVKPPFPLAIRTLLGKASIAIVAQGRPVARQLPECERIVAPSFGPSGARWRGMT